MEQFSAFRIADSLEGRQASMTIEKGKQYTNFSRNCIDKIEYRSNFPGEIL